MFILDLLGLCSSFERRVQGSLQATLNRAAFELGGKIDREGWREGGGPRGGEGSVHLSNLGVDETSHETCRWIVNSQKHLQDVFQGLKPRVLGKDSCFQDLVTQTSSLTLNV